MILPMIILLKEVKKMGAQGSQAGISIIKESVWGTKPVGQFKGVNFVSEDMLFEIENKVPNTIRPDRQTLELIQVGAETAGGFETEFQAENVDDLLVASLYDSNWHFLNGSDNTGLTAGATGSNLDFEINAGTKILTLGSAITHAIVVDQLITLAGWSEAGNNGTHLVTAVSGNDITLETTTLVNETVQATATIKGDYIRNGVIGSSFSIQRSLNDISQFSLFTGMTPNTVFFSLESGEPVMCNFSFVGKSKTLTQTTNSSPAESSPSTNKIINAVSDIGSIAIDGVSLSGCLLQSYEVTVDNKVEGKTGVGVLGFCNAREKSLLVNGKISLYFEDETYADKYLNSESFSIQTVFVDADGNTYTLRIPNCKFNSLEDNVSGKDDDVILDGEYTASIGTAGYTIQITRALV